MIVSCTLIICVAMFDMNPLALFMLCITFIPDVAFLSLLEGKLC